MDLVVEVEKAVLAHLKADPAVAAILTIYTQQAPATPTKPFVKPGTQIAGPLTGHRRRRDIRFPLFVRADARMVNNQLVESARDHMGRCVSAVVDSLYRSRLRVFGGTAKFVLVNDIRRNVDGEADAMEANIEFRVRAIAG